MLEKTLLFGNVNSFPDMPQVFHHDYIARVAGVDDSFGDPVVEVGHPAALPTAQPFQEAFSPLRALGLERLPQPGVPPPDVHGLQPGKLQAVGGGCEVVDAAVDAGNVAAFRLKRNFPVNNNVDVELFRSLVVAKGGRSGFLSSEQSFLEVPNGKREFEPAGYRGDRNLPTLFIEGKGALVEAHAGRFELPGLGQFPLLFGHFGYAGNSADDEVSLQAVLFLDGAVAEVLEFDLVGGAVFLRNAEDVVANIDKPLQSFQENSCLFSINLKFAPDSFDKLHSFILYHIRGSVNCAFLPRLKSRGLRRGKGVRFLSFPG